MTHELLRKAEKSMKERAEYLRHSLATVRTGRASLAILDGITVDYYGTPTPLNQVASLNIPEATLIVAQPWEASLIPAIEKAIQRSDLGLNPNNDGKVVRIPIPPLTEDRRKSLAKKIQHLGEEERTHIRLLRREANEQAKALLKEKKMSEDEEHKILEQVQNLTDKYVKAIDELVKAKEKEILEV
jgi:ribosome recycling factor